MRYPCTGVILAGGKNRRLPGKKKALIEIDGSKILDHILSIFSDLFEETIIITNDPLDFLEWDQQLISDINRSRCSLAGIHTGLYCAKTPYIFVCACDTPFLKKDLVKAVLKSIEPGKDVFIPSTSTGFEPLCAVYSKNCLCRIESNLEKNIYAIRAFFNDKRVKKIPEEVLRKADPHLDSFFNINTPEDLMKAMGGTPIQYEINSR